jgi:ABC-2 type transport system permease protein
MLTQLRGLVAKDLRVFVSDRRAVIMTIIAPIAIASFFGSVFSGMSDGGRTRIAVAMIDEDQSAVSKAVLAGSGADASITITTPPREEARRGVRSGDIAVAVIIPAGFGEAAGRAFLSGVDQPQLTVWYDPSRSAEVALVRGILTQHVMEAVSQEMFSGSDGLKMIDDTLARLGDSGMPSDQQATLRSLLQSARELNRSGAATGQRRGLTMPYTVKEEAVTSGSNVTYNAYAHAFAGMAVQFLLFAAIDLGTGILLERERGIWKRLRSAPIGKMLLLGSRLSSATIIGLLSLLASFGFAIVVFGVRVEGSQLGFALVGLSCAIMSAAFGLLIASIGKTPGATRGVSILVVLIMVMLGGAWVPTFIFPPWVQRVTVVVPARWAVDGFDAMTWRGLGIGAAVLPTAVMLGFAALFAAVAAARFRWEEA